MVADDVAGGAALSAGVVDVICSQNLPTGTQKLVELLKHTICAGEFNPFSGMGIVREINAQTERVTVEFDEQRMVEYTYAALEELELAYAVTIHKSQGSEYPAIVIPLLSGPRMLMTRNLLYTAVTRARKCVTLVGDERTFTQMIDNTMEQKRYTALAARIQELSAM